MYQRLESKGNPRLDTLELVAKGLNSELMLIPSSKANAVKAMLGSSSEQSIENINQNSEDDPWSNVLGDDS